MILNGVSWEHFEAWLAMRGDTAGPRIAFRDGVLEIMSPSRSHERIKKMLERLMKARGRRVAIEPDDCYGLQPLRSEAQPPGAHRR